MTRTRRAATGTVLALGLAVAAMGASSPDVSAARGDTAGATASPAPGADWQAWSGYTPACPIDALSSQHRLDPVRWAPCDSGSGCEQLDTRWRGEDGPWWDATFLGAAVALEDGRAQYLLVGRTSKADASTMWLAVDPDTGRALAGVRRTHPGAPSSFETGCHLYGNAVTARGFVLKARGHDAADARMSKVTGGIAVELGGSVESLGVFRPGEGPSNVSWGASEAHLLRFGSSWRLVARSWSGGPEQVLTSPALDPDGYKASQIVAAGGGVFWTAADLHGGGIMAWHPETGTQPLIRSVGDRTRIATNIGTDGVDLVWSEGEGKLPEETAAKLPVRRIMTAPFTTSPAELQPRELRPLAGRVVEPRPWLVGCGYGVLESQNRNLLVRLSDGRQWDVSSHASEAAEGRPLGVDCEHVYVKSERSVARVRIDALGPGMPPG